MSTEFNAVTDFSTSQNPNGVWTYTNGVTYTFSGTASGYDFWAADSTPGSTSVLYNTTAAPVDIGTIELPVGQLGLDPGAGTGSGVLFTAPAKAYYSVTGGFVGIDTSQASHLAGVVAQGRFFFESFIETFGQTAQFALVLLLNAGDTIAFANAGNGVGNTATALSATVFQAANFGWKNTAGGDFDTGSNWVQGAVPGVGDSVSVRVGGAYTITSSADHWLTRLEIRNDRATLLVNAGTFSTQQLVNAGSIVVGDASTDAALVLEGKAVNSGTISLTGGMPSTLAVGATGLLLTGGGSLMLGGSGAAITGTGGVLNNVNNVIAGMGELGDGAIGLLNGKAGVIEARGGILHVSTASQIVNSGTMRAAGGSTLAIASDVLSKNGGTFQASGPGAEVIFDNVTLSGRTTLQADAGGTFAVGAGLTTVAQVLSNNADLSIDAAGNGADTALMLVGDTINTGTITVTGGDPASAQLQVCDSTVHLGGGGSIVLAGVEENSGIVGTTANSRLINDDNTIEGAGYIGQGFCGSDLQLVNRLGGTIDANVGGGTLLIDVPDVVVNQGTMQATNGGTLALRGEIRGGTGSVFKASGGDIILDNADLSGEVVMQADDGSAIVVAAGQSSLAGEIFLSGDVTIDAVANGDDTALMLEGKVENSGTITLTSTDVSCGCGPLADLTVCDGQVTLLGGGLIVLSGESAALFSTSPYSKLVNIDNTIEGEGLVGDGFMPIVNKFGGTIDANVAGRTMWLTTGFGSSNAGTIEATNGASLDVQGFLKFASGGVLKTVGASSSIMLNGAAFIDATLDASAGGAIEIGAAAMQGNISFSGALMLDAQDYGGDRFLGLAGRVTNDGVVTLVGGFDADDPATEFFATVTVTQTVFQGGGRYVLSGNPDSTMIFGLDPSARLSNLDNTIEGAGFIGNLLLVNQANGLIDANVSGETLVVDTGSSAIVNRGTFEASDGGHLFIASAVSKHGFGTIDGGTLEFRSSVNISVSFTDNGGTLAVDDSDVFKGSVAGLADGNMSQMSFADIDFASVMGTFTENGAGTAGAFELGDGVDTARITLLGQYANNFSVGPPSTPGFVGFVLADDGTVNHGTLVTYVGS